MPKNKFKTRTKKVDGEEKKGILVADIEGQIYGIIEKVLGGRYFDVRCFDNKKRRCKARNKRIKLTPQDYVIVSLRSFDDKNGDIIHKYELPEIRKLQNDGVFPHDDNVNNSDNNELDNDLDSFNFEEI